MIHLKNIVKQYGNTSALKQINLEIRNGELVTLIGPSGCGKSTLLRVINRMIEPTSGEILIHGENALNLDPVKLRRSIGYVIQNAGLFPHLTVEKNVEIVTELLGWDKAKRKQRAQELLHVVGLAPEKFAHRYPKELSGGQQQRVGIARALAADPAILLMDEPFSAVDPITREQLQAGLLAIQTQVKKTIVFVTHDIHEAVRLGDKVALMQEGEIVQFDTPDQILKSPKNDFVAQFLGQERELQRLSLHLVGDIIQQGHGFFDLEQVNINQEHTISIKANARNALSKLLSGVPSLLVLDDDEKPIARVSVHDFIRGAL
ncbi:ABC transporter ATP-binding protein [Acinetobacter gerneri]|uniref:Quaternary amine transport ATP-binding protein n=1 Tax=Acinetobacter gerneri TaxID=202952 RepID=A0AAW8JMC9_9GAMM|nr:ABC transporter ATP-binding protein [Acinetobacter gerneri]MDQ9011985.1 ABC transporter ATP-binding protein [Acinetobacter gerneri]MDQ9016090.1 ABC transporter ATP-binding protein [Acinetobacter gerneri]MDQ9027261.1 ABC transporter ATP-binding protein [Acinetobacter gerneri]MDQ9054568.1 ABC transporter ATP-binding protein [Acinetobacter gerneri]MDQ9062212.1 ABC transporter ATP-binding protein [Acinetobacter gerneri]